MKDLYLIYKECVKECLDASIPIRHEHIVELNTTSKYLSFTFGVCGKTEEDDGSFTFTISIHPSLLEDDCPMKETKEIIIHELIHTCNRCWSHSKTFIKYAKILDEMYGYELMVAKGVYDIFRKDLPILHHYICPKCGVRYNSRLEKINEEFKCVFCRTPFVQID